MRFIAPLSAFAAMACLCLAASAQPQSDLQSAPPDPSLARLDTSMPALIAAMSSGSEKACVPTHLTVTGPVVDGSRIFVSALVSEFTSELRKSAKGKVKLTRAQAGEMQRLVNYATAAQNSAEGLPKEALEQIARSTGFFVKASLVCLSTESISSK